MPWMILLALPPLSAAQIMLLLDRYLDANFFKTQAGGSAVLWQHFFWIFGHPEVYILIFPAFAILSEVIPVFSRKPIFGTAGDGGSGRRNRVHQLWRVGASYVRGWHDVVVEYLLRGLQHAGGCANGHQNFQLDCDHVWREAAFLDTTCCSAAAFCCNSFWPGLRASCSPWRPLTGNFTIHISWWRIFTSR